MRRLVLAALLVAATAAPATVSAEGLPYGPSVSFAVFRNGQEIGRHTLVFQQTGSQVAVSCAIDFAVKVLGFTAYRYSHRSYEVWQGNTFMSLTAQTDDNGKKYTVDLQRGPTGLQVERSAQAGDAIQAASAYEGFHHPPIVRETVPAHILPTTHWNARQVRQAILLNTQYGTQSHVQIVVMGREAVKTMSGNNLQATHYRYSGDVRMDQWFDDRGRWVQAAFTAFDGSAIEYILQE
jgi:hypothetical protein